MISLNVETWIAAMWIFIVLSFTIKDNPLFRFAQATMIGTTTGVLTAIGIDNIRRLSFLPLVRDGAYLNIIPLLIGLLLFTRINRRYAHLSRIPLALMLGVGIGAGITRNISSMIIGQISGIMKPFPTGAMGIINLAIFLAGLFGTILVFTYTTKRVGTFGTATKIGQHIIVFALGAHMGSAITMRATTVIQRLQLIFYNLLGL